MNFIVHRLAQRIVQGDVPQALMNRRVCVPSKAPFTLSSLYEA